MSWRNVFVWTSVGAASLGLGAPLARAGAESMAWGGGLALLEQFGPAVIGPPQSMELNGERIWVASKVTPLGVAEVLNSVNRGCAGLSSEAEKVPSALRALLPSRDRLLSERTGHSFGQVACFDGKAAGLRLLERARTFAESGDLAAFGNARYVVARRDADADKTHVLAIWTEGPFNVRALFPSQGDSAGSDSALVSRPAGSVRLLCVRRFDSAGAIRVYKTSEPRTTVLDAFSRELGRKGFAPATLPASRGADELTEAARAFFKDGVGVIVTASEGLLGGTIVSVVELESGGRTAVERQETP